MFEPVIWIAVAAVFAYFLFNMFRRGGMRGAMFNARISDTSDDIEAGGSTVKVHRLDRDGLALIGLEIVTTGLGYEVMPIVLSPRQAQRLVSSLQKALGEKRPS